MKPQKKVVWAWVHPSIREAVERIAKSKGISISEYVRSLILEDLEKRNIINAVLKEEMKSNL